MSDSEKYIEPGKQTLITSDIKERVLDFKGTTIDIIREILDTLRDFRMERFNKEIFRKRTANEIIKSGFVTGCTDYALVFIVLSRACGIPVKYVETIDKEWLINGGNSFTGHIYSKIYDESKNEWIWVDPMRGRIGDNLEDFQRVIYKEGLDSWDIGIFDFESLEKVFLEFRDNWLKAH